jgi:hypothetical protein
MTCSTRNSCAVFSIPARSSRRRTDVLPPSTLPTRSAAERSTGPKAPAAAEAGDDETTRSAGVRPTCGRSRTYGSTRVDSCGRPITRTRASTSRMPAPAIAPSGARE